MFLGASFCELPSSLTSILEEDKGVTATSTKLACTIGPVSRDVDTLKELLRAGMKIARFDFTYGLREYHQQSIDNLRIAMKATHTLTATMLDTAGPELVVLNRPAAPIVLQAGQTITLTCNQEAPASALVLPISTIKSFEGVQPGASVFIGAYLFTGAENSSAYLTVQQVDKDTCVCICNNDCTLAGMQLTVFITGYKSTAPILSDEDVKNIELWGVKNEVDFISLSFTRSAQDVHDCRAVLDKFGLIKTKIFAKIEEMEGLVNHKEIMDAADAIIFSRGNLGVGLDAEKVFLAQKMLLRACNLAGKPVFVTRVVDTMTDAPRPTRAEATDVANLVLDGADGILLGSETFRGKYPIATVRTVALICKQAEQCFDSQDYYRCLMDHYGAYTLTPHMSQPEALASSLVRAAGKMQAALIVVFTVTGRTARLIAKYKPSQPILAVVCKDPQSATGMEDSYSSNVNKTRVIQSEGFEYYWGGDVEARQCLSYRGVIPLSADPTDQSTHGAVLDYALAFAERAGLIKQGDRVVVSQCPRINSSSQLEERGVVKLVTVEHSYEHRSLDKSQLQNVGSVMDLAALQRA